MIRTVAIFLALMAAGPVQAQQAHLLVIVGLGGDEPHRQQFHEWAIRLLDAATTGYGLAADQVHYLGEKVDLDPGRISARSTSENVASTVRAIASQASPEDDVFVVLIGHGSARGSEARFNLPGPDLGPADFALLLDDLAPRRVAFVNTAASSGGFLEDISGEHRAVLTATRSAREQNETVFAGYFVEAFEGEDADLDKDGRVSLLEAFRYASAETRRHYEDQSLLLTEHAVLDDNGDRAGEAAPSPLETDGQFAASLFLAPPASGTSTADAVAASPELQALFQTRDSLQARVRELRGVQGGLDPEEYDRRLEALLVELGLVAREIRALAGSGEP